ncbi:MAG: hypothetical protein Q8P67_24920 [archaeon]|nr:hypothetical protein [archaeon]
MRRSEDGDSSMGLPSCASALRGDVKLDAAGSLDLLLHARSPASRGALVHNLSVTSVSQPATPASLAFGKLLGSIH